jgi:hypothetical protein
MPTKRTMLERILGKDFEDFWKHLPYDAEPEHILHGATSDEITQLENDLNITLPTRYKDFLTQTKGFWLYGGAVQIGYQHTFRYEFPPLEELTPQQRENVKRKGGKWPPACHGHICISEFWRDADGDQAFLKIDEPTSHDEFSIYYYSHETIPPFIEKIADSFDDFLNYVASKGSS